VNVVGGGLAGVEAAWQAAEQGAQVRLHEMRPVMQTPAHRTDQLAEIVCSNSLKTDEPGTAPYLLKEELRRGGSLVLEAAAATRVPAGAALSVDRGKFAEYTSGSVETFSKAGWKHARVEVRAKCPRGWGMWPAIWMMGENITEVGWPTCGEIDVMENVGFEPDRIHAAIHVKGEEGEKRELSETASAQVGRLAKEFHVYAMEWDAKQVRVWVDDRPYFTYDRFDAKGEEKPWPFDQRLYLKLNLAIGGTWGGRHGIDDTVFPQKFLIDYVRVYERTEPAERSDNRHE